MNEPGARQKDPPCHSALMPRTINMWPRAFSFRNIMNIAHARRRGATVSFNQVKLDKSTIDRNALILSHALVQRSHVSRYAIVAPYSSLFESLIGPYCSIAEKSVIGALPHWPELPTSHVFPRNHEFGFYNGTWPEVPSTRVGADVWVGASAIIKAGVTIGHGAIVASGAVVTKDVDDFEIVAGVPAGHLRYRFQRDWVKRLLALSWWDWPSAYIRENIDLFRLPVTEDTLRELETQNERLARSNG